MCHWLGMLRPAPVANTDARGAGKHFKHNGQRYAARTISPASRAASLPRCQSPPKHAWKLTRAAAATNPYTLLRGLSIRAEMGTKPDRSWSLAGERQRRASYVSRTSPPAKDRGCFGGALRRRRRDARAARAAQWQRDNPDLAERQAAARSSTASGTTRAAPWRRRSCWRSGSPRLAGLQARVWHMRPRLHVASMLRRGCPCCRD
jgi:hypothetical protein